MANWRARPRSIWIKVALRLIPTRASRLREIWKVSFRRHYVRSDFNPPEPVGTEMQIGFCAVMFVSRVGCPRRSGTGADNGKSLRNGRGCDGSEHPRSQGHVSERGLEGRARGDQQWHWLLYLCRFAAGDVYGDHCGAGLPRLAADGDYRQSWRRAQCERHCSRDWHGQ